MYIAHKCPKCVAGDVRFNLDGEQHKCNSCGYSEDSDVFKYFQQQERHIRDLENKIEDMLPFKDLSQMDSLIDLTIGCHVTGRIEFRDNYMKNLMKHTKDVLDKWQVCYIGFSRIENKIEQYEQTAARQEDSSKYSANIKSAKDFFKNLPNELKEIYKACFIM